MTLYLIIGTLVTMRIFGIDPGLATIGFAVVDANGHKLIPISYGAITTPPHHSIGQRLVTIADNINQIIQTYQPDVCAIEQIYFGKNVKTAMKVTQARGVIVYCVEKHGIPTFNYSPTAVKSAILGFGGAEKKQVQFMTKEILNLRSLPKPDDVADALAIAICHHHSHSIQSRV
jgi:crossover junction endodeoxyribonuclease RuvC